MNCPHCGAKTHSHSLTIWCADCGWGRNRTAPAINGEHLLAALSKAWDESPMTQRLVCGILGVDRPRR